MEEKFIFVSESVTEGHPDKLCDQISDALVDEYLQQDQSARADVECVVANGVVFIGAHTRGNTDVNVAETARRVIGTAGYHDGEFNAGDCTILTSLNEVSFPTPVPVIPEDADDAWLDGFVAQDQATVFGFACRQTPELMPAPIQIAHRIARRLDEVRRSGELAYLMPDAKSQVAVEYDGRQPRRVDTVSVVTGVDIDGGAHPADLTGDLVDAVLRPALEGCAPGADERTRFLVNHDGQLRPGGPAMHSGLTGRKNAVDSYGEFSRHSGSALSGKDLISIERMGAYAARHAAKNIVAAGLAEQCQVQLSYTIGLARPVGVHVETFGTGKLPPVEVSEKLQRHFEFRPAGILRDFDLRSVYESGHGHVFRPLAVYGQVGRTDLDLPWEKTDKIDALTQ